MHLVDEIGSGPLHRYRRFLPASVGKGSIFLVLHIRELDQNHAADGKLFPLLDLIAGTIAQMRPSVFAEDGSTMLLRLGGLGGIGVIVEHVAQLAGGKVSGTVVIIVSYL